MIYILDTFPNLSENFILREISALRKLGIKIRIYALKKPADEPINSNARPFLGDVCYVQQFSFLDKISAFSGTFFTHPALIVKLLFSLFFDMFFSWRLMYHRLRGAVNAMTIAKSAGLIEHVHAHFAFVTVDVARFLAALKGCKWSVSAHAWDIFTQPAGILRRRLQDADAIFVCSKHGKERLGNKVSEIRDKVILMYHGLDMVEFQDSSSGDYIIAVGRLEPKKGFEVLLRAGKMLAEEKIKPRFLIVGDGPLRAGLQEEIEKSGLANFEITGSLEFGKVKELMAGSLMLVQPSVVTDDGDHDGIPNVLLEAMALGKPVITTDVGGISEVIENGVNGVIVEERNEAKLAMAIKDLLDNDDKEKKIGVAGKKFVKENFEISENIKPLAEYLRSLEK